MANTKSNNIRLGVFVTLVLIIFTVGVYNIGSKQNLFGSKLAVSTVVSNANGLQKGNNVRYAGINVGIVDQIIFVNDSTLQIMMLLEDRMQEVIKKNAVASIGSDGLVGNMIVNLNPGLGMASAIAEGDVLASLPRTEAKDMLSSLDKSSQNIAALTTNLLSITEKINQGSGTLSLLLNDPNTSQDLATAIHDFQKTAASISTMSKTLEGSLAEVSRGEGLLGYLLKDTSLQENIDQWSTSLDSTITQHTAQMVLNLESASERIEKSTKDLQAKVEELSFEEGVVGTLLKDSIMAEDLKQVIKNLELGTDGFQQNMEALKHNFLFRKYFKKQEKKRKEAMNGEHALRQNEIVGMEN